MSDIVKTRKHRLPLTKSEYDELSVYLSKKRLILFDDDGDNAKEER